MANRTDRRVEKNKRGSSLTTPQRPQLTDTHGCCRRRRRLGPRRHLAAIEGERQSQQAAGTPQLLTAALLSRGGGGEGEKAGRSASV